MTELNERESEFFEKLHALCVEYGASVYGNADKVETAANYGMGDEYMTQSFSLAIAGREFREIHVNYRESGRQKPPAITSVEDDYMSSTLVLHKLD